MINVFRPKRRNGLLLTGAVIVLFFVGIIFSGLRILNSAVDLGLALNLLLFFFSVVMVFYWGTRVYGLVTARYSFDRDFLLIEWGLRKEKLPISDIEWIRAYADGGDRLSLPFFRMPGQIVGNVFDNEWGTIEYFASEMGTLIFIGTSKRIFGISPNDPAGFVNAFNRNVEMGSLERGGGRSENAGLIVLEILRSNYNRFVIFVNFFLNIGMMIWITIIAPNIATISLGFTSDLKPADPVIGSQILLIPILSWIFSLFGFFIGLVLYQFPDKRDLANMLWTSNVVTTLLLLISIPILLTTGAAST